MIIEAQRSASLRTGFLVLGLAVILAVAVLLAYATTVSAQGESGAPPVPATEPTSTPEAAPDGKGKDDDDDAGADGATGASGASGAACGVTSLGTLAGSTTRTGYWNSGCYSANRSGRYAQFYSFTMNEAADVVIDLTSSADTYLYLLNGSGTAGSVVTRDDDGGDGYNSRIEQRLSAGTYTVETTTFGRSTTGSFSVSVRVSQPCISDLGTVNGSVTRAGMFSRDCTAQRRSGRYARYYTFNVPAQSEVTIDLASSGIPVVDAHLYLLSGTGRTGSFVESDSDDGPGSDARIFRTLSPGSYTVEATTNNSSTVGSFSLTVSAGAIPCEMDLGAIAGAVTREGVWASGCDSENRSGANARYYTFTLASAETVQISLDSTGSPTVDAYLNLLSGSGVDGGVVAYDDDDGPGRNAYLSRWLPAGTYTVEATTRWAGHTGDFRLSVAIFSSAFTSCGVSSMGIIASDARDARVGYWGTNCASQNRAGRHARFYSFYVSGTSDVRIDLRSTDDPEIDTYLYLISGASKSGSVLERDDDGGDARNSRIERRLTAGVYTVEVTTFHAARVGGFALSLEVEKPFVDASPAVAFEGQSVILSADAPASKGSVSGYQWQRWNGSSWSNYGSSSLSATRSVSYGDAGKHTFRVMVTYAAGGQGTSAPVSAEWVKVAHAAYAPEAPDLNETVVLMVDISDAPPGTTYQWQQKSSSGWWQNIGTESASRSRTEASAVKVTKQYRVVARYRSGSWTVTDTSETIYVTWGEARLVGDIIRDLGVELFGSSGDGATGASETNGNAILRSAETSFLACVNTGRSTDDRFASFYDVLDAYDGAVATTVDTCETRSSNPTKPKPR